MEPNRLVSCPLSSELDKTLLIADRNKKLC